MAKANKEIIITEGELKSALQSPQMLMNAIKDAIASAQIKNCSVISQNDGVIQVTTPPNTDIVFFGDLPSHYDGIVPFALRTSANIIVHGSFGDPNSNNTILDVAHSPQLISNNGSITLKDVGDDCIVAAQGNISAEKGGKYTLAIAGGTIALSGAKNIFEKQSIDRHNFLQFLTAKRAEQLTEIAQDDASPHTTNSASHQTVAQYTDNPLMFEKQEGAFYELRDEFRQAFQEKISNEEQNTLTKYFSKNNWQAIISNDGLIVTDNSNTDEPITLLSDIIGLLKKQECLI
jgi:hypothetical protein